MNIPTDLPHGHEKSYRRGKGDGFSTDKRIPIDIDNIPIPTDLPNGHEKSYKRGFEKGLEER